MDGINALLTIIFLLIISFIALIRASSITAVSIAFILLTIIAYMTIYLFKAE